MILLTILFVLSGLVATGGGGGSSSSSEVAGVAGRWPPSVSGVVDDGELLDGWLKLCWLCDDPEWCAVCRKLGLGEIVKSTVAKHGHKASV